MTDEVRTAPASEATPPPSDAPVDEHEALRAIVRELLDDQRAEVDEEVFRLELRADATHEGVLLLRVLVVLLLLVGLVLLRGLLLG